MDEVATFDLAYLVVALVAFYVALNVLDRLGRQKFRDLWRILRANPVALSIYLGSRIVAVAFLVGLSLLV